MREFVGLLPYVLVPYSIVVGVVYLSLLALWKRFRADDRDLRLLWIPPVFYLLLTTVHDRQGLAALHGLAIVTIAVVLALPLKVYLVRYSAAVAIAGIGCAAAVVAWLAVPRAPMGLPIWGG